MAALWVAPGKFDRGRGTKKTQTAGLSLPMEQNAELHLSLFWFRGLC